MKSFRPGKAGRRSATNLKSVSAIFADAVRMLGSNKWLFFKAVLIHAVIYFFIVRAPEAISVGDITDLVNGAEGEDKGLAKRTYDLTITVLGLKTSGIQQPLQALVVWVVTSLSYIWIMREIIARNKNADRKKILAREGYYRGQTGFSSVVMVILTMVVELIPFGVGFWIYNTADSNVIFTNGFEQSLFIAIWVALALVSVFSLMRSAIAVYFATIPDVFPLEAQQMSSSVMRFRRQAVLFKVVNLLIILLLMASVLVIGAIALAPKYAFVAVDAVLVLSVPAYHLMFYHLYLDLVKDHSADS